MDITVKRIISTSEATLSEVSVDGKFFCYGLEDEKREVKVAGETCIPAGTYKIAVRTTGGFHQRYADSKHHQDYHRGMLHVQDVPNFTHILIHTGNHTGHTKGCLLVGESYNQSGENITVGSSRTAYKNLYCKVIDAAEAGKLSITYEESPS